MEAAERILELTADASVADLDMDRSRREALLWSFTVLGEASSQLDTRTTESHPEVAWRAATDLRNRIVHSYWQISTAVARIGSGGAGIARIRRVMSPGRPTDTL